MSFRRGSILIDAAVATALLAALLTFSLRAMTTMAAGRRAGEHRAVAVQLAAGALERAGALAWDDLTSEKLAALAHDHPIDAALSGAQLKLFVDESTGDPSGRHVCAEISWPTNSKPTKPVKLHRWFHRPAEVTP